LLVASCEAAQSWGFHAIRYNGGNPRNTVTPECEPEAFCRVRLLLAERLPEGDTRRVSFWLLIIFFMINFSLLTPNF